MLTQHKWWKFCGCFFSFVTALRVFNSLKWLTLQIDKLVLDRSTYFRSRSECSSDSCKIKRTELENELKQLKHDLKMREEKLRQMERETQVICVIQWHFLVVEDASEDFDWLIHQVNVLQEVRVLIVLGNWFW